MKYLKKKENWKSTSELFLNLFTYFLKMSFSLSPWWRYRLNDRIPRRGGGEGKLFSDIENDMIPYFMMKNKSPPPPHIYLPITTNNNYYIFDYYLYRIKGLLPACSRLLTLPSTGRVFTKGPRDLQNKRPPRQASFIFLFEKILFICPCSVSVWSCWPASSSFFWEVGLSV